MLWVRFRFGLDHITVLVKAVALQTPGALPVLNGVDGAVLDAAHAVRAARRGPDGLAVLHSDHLQRTAARALAAGDAGVRHMKAVGSLPKTHPDGIKGERDENLPQPDMAGAEPSSQTSTGNAPT